MWAPQLRAFGGRLLRPGSDVFSTSACDLNSVIKLRDVISREEDNGDNCVILFSIFEKFERFECTKCY